MRMYDLIMKKRNGMALSDEEIRFIVDGYTKGDIPDYQMSAFTMAVFFQGMDSKETGFSSDKSLIQELPFSGISTGMKRVAPKTVATPKTTKKAVDAMSTDFFMPLF